MSLLGGAVAVLPLAAVVADRRRIGGKAAALARLISSEAVRVPQSWVLDVNAFDWGLELCGLAESYNRVVSAFMAGQEESSLLLTDFISRFRLVDSIPELTAILQDGIAAYAYPLAVRSSSPFEDSELQSAAGRYVTVLGTMTPEAAGKAVLSCWLSAFLPNDLIARFGQSAKLSPNMGVLIQPTLAAQASGVCFSVDPMDRRRRRLVIEATLGLASPLVAGSITPDRFLFERDDLTLISEVRGSKALITTLGPEGVITTVQNESDLLRTAALTIHEASLVALAALACERVFGLPQDVEWVLCENHIWIVQSRPIVCLTRQSLASRETLHKFCNISLID